MVPAARVGGAAEHHRVVRRAAHAAAADIHGHHAVAPVGRVRDAVLHPHIVDRVPRRIQLETPDPVGIRRVLGVEDVVTPAGGERVDVVFGDEHIVDAARQLVVVARDDLHAVLRIAHIQDDQAVLAIRSAFPADDAELPVLGDLHIVHRARVHPDGVDEAHGRGIGHIPEVRVAVGAPGAGHRVVAAVRPFPDPEVGGMPVAHRRLPQYLDILADLARDDAQGRRRRPGESVRDHRVGAGALGHERAVGADLPDRAGRDDPVGRRSQGGELDRVVGHRVAAGVLRLGGEEHHIAGPHRVVGLGAGQRDRPHRVRGHHDLGVARRLLRRDGERGAPFAGEHQDAQRIHRRHRIVGGAEPDLHIVPFRPGNVFDLRPQRDLGAGVEIRRQVRHRHGGHRRVRNRHRDLHPHRRFGAAVEVLRILRHHGDQRVFARPVGLDDPRRVHAHRTAAAGEEDDGAIHRVAVRVPHLGLERERVSHFEFHFGGSDDEFRRLRAGLGLFLLLREHEARGREQAAGEGGARDGRRDERRPRAAAVFVGSSVHVVLPGVLPWFLAKEEAPSGGRGPHGSPFQKAMPPACLPTAMSATRSAASMS